MLTMVEKMDYKAISERVRLLREQRNLTQKELAEGIGVTSQYITQIEKGQRAGKFVLGQIANFLGVDIEVLYGGKPIPEYHQRALKHSLREALKRLEDMEVRELPILGHPPCGFPLSTEENAEGYVTMLKDDLGYAREKPGLYALIASGNCLSNDGIVAGTKLIVDPTDIEVIDGKIYVVLTPENEVTVKHVYKYGNKIKLVPSNDKYKSLEYSQVKILGRVIISGNWEKR